MILSHHREVARNAIVIMIKAAIVVQEVNKNFSKVYLRNFSRIIIPLKKTYNHQEESI
jgi:hypothetical protein